MKINVIGASGRLGQKVMAALLAQGAAPGDLTASVRTPAKAKTLGDQGISLREADYDRPDLLQTAFQDSEVLVIIPSTAAVEQRIQQFAHTLQAAAAVGVQRLVFTSFSTARPDSQFVVAPYLLYAEAKLRLSGLGWTILRHGMYLDPIADWIPELITMGHLPYPVRTGRVAYISRDDLARATAAACLNPGHEGQLYELTGSEALSMPELAEIIANVTGQSIPFKSITDAEFAEVCRQGQEDVSEGMIEALISLYRAVEQGEFASVTDHVEHLTGQPPEAVAQYLQRALR